MHPSKIGFHYILNIELLYSSLFSYFRSSEINISVVYHRKDRKKSITHTQSFVLCNVEDGPTKHIGTSTAVLKARRGAFTHWTCPLPSGTYVLIPFSVSFWEKQVRDSERNYTLVIHAKIPIELELVKEPASLLADCLIAAIIKEPETKNEVNSINFFLAVDLLSIRYSLAWSL